MSAIVSVHELLREARKVQGVWLPQGRQVVRQDRDGLTVRELRLSGHALLEA